MNEWMNECMYVYQLLSVGDTLGCRGDRHVFGSAVKSQYTWKASAGLLWLGSM